MVSSSDLYTFISVAEKRLSFHLEDSFIDVAFRMSLGVPVRLNLVALGSSDITTIWANCAASYSY